MLMRASWLTLLCAALGACRPPMPPPSVVPPMKAAETPPSPTLAPKPAFSYPAARRGGVVDDYHGTMIADPYRWLEDLDSPETRVFVAAENQLTDSVLAGLPRRAELKRRIGELSRYTRFGHPVRRGKHWFWTVREPDREQAVLYTAASLEGTLAPLVDPGVVSPDGHLAFEGYVPSESGERIVYGMAVGGGDWQEWRIRDVESTKDLPDVLSGIKYYAPQLTVDGKGVYYSRFPAPQPGRELRETDHDCRVYYHAVGTPASSDVVLFERPDQPSWQFEPHLTRGGRYLVILVGDGEVGDRGVEQVYVLDVSRRGAKPVPVVTGVDAEYQLLGAHGSTLLFKTTAGAPRKRIVAIDLDATSPPGAAHPKEIVPEGPDAIEDAVLAGGKLFVTTLKDAHHALAVYDRSGKKIRDVGLPGLGTVSVAEGNDDDPEAFFGFQSFTFPSTLYRHDVKSGATTPFRAPKVAFVPDDFETRQVFYPGKDGTKIPMFLTAMKGRADARGVPTLLTGYGGFGVSITPELKPELIAWLERGGVLAVANVRGGGEYGEAWHQAATKERKQVTFDDFIAAAEWLLGTGVTTKDKLGIYGRSGGGLLVGAVAMERPDLFGAVAPLAGVLDMLRFPLYGQGAGWESDFGSPAVPSELASLRAYSPLHNVRPGTRYPAMYIVTADHDVRVAPLHSYKFAAALQWAQAADRPVLLRVLTTSGHGGGTTVSAKADQQAELLSFFELALGGP